MRIAIATIEGVSTYSQNRCHDMPKLSKENSKDYEERTWRDRAHIDKDGCMFIPPMAFKNCLSEVAKYLSIQIPGKGKSTYTKHFEAGIMVVDPLVLNVTKEEIEGQWLFLPVEGQRGGKKRVWKCFPVVHEWKGDVIFHILDDTITEEVFEQHLSEAGKMIGIGRFRPRNNGYYGRFKVNEIVWE